MGSVLVGSADFIAKAHRWRKDVWRRLATSRFAGCWMSACHLTTTWSAWQRIMPSTNHRGRMDELPGFSVDLATVQTNMVYAETTESAADVVAKFAAQGIDMFDLADNRIRIVVHLHITDEDIAHFGRVEPTLPCLQIDWTDISLMTVCTRLSLASTTKPPKKSMPCVIGAAPSSITSPERMECSPAASEEHERAIDLFGGSSRHITSTLEKSSIESHGARSVGSLG